MVTKPRVPELQSGDAEEVRLAAQLPAAEASLEK
jgi:hypothetical protein